MSEPNQQIRDTGEKMWEATRLRRVEGFDWRALDIWVVEQVAQRKAGDWDHMPLKIYENNHVGICPIF